MPTRNIYLNINSVNALKILSLLKRHKAQLMSHSIPSTVAGKVPIGIAIGAILMMIMIKLTYKGNVSVHFD